MIEQSGAEQGWLTHLGHETDCWLMANASALPNNVTPAADGLCFDITTSLSPA